MRATGRPWAFRIRGGLRRWWVRDRFVLLSLPTRWPRAHPWLWIAFGFLAMSSSVWPEAREGLRLLLQNLLRGGAETAERLILGGGPFTGVAVLLWVLASFLTAPQARFWEEVERRGFRVIFPSGDRWDFLLEASRLLPLGLGPTGELLPFYVRRGEETEIRDRLSRTPVVIAGPPASGKTRTMLEIAADLNPPFVLIWTRDVRPDPFPEGIQLPARGGLLLIDDLSPPIEETHEDPLPDPIPSLRYRCPELRVLATARLDRIPPDLRGPHVVKLREIPREDRNLRELSIYIAKKEGRQIDEIWKRYNGHPGSLVAGLDAMRRRLEALGQEFERLGLHNAQRRAEIGRAFLQSVRLLWEMGVRTLTLERVWAVVERVWSVSSDGMDRDNVLKALQQLSFCRLEDSQVRFYEGILTEVIPSPVDRKQKEEQAWAALWERKDAAAFEEIGNTWSKEYGPAYQRNPREALRRAIEAYQEALRFRTPETAPLDYAATQNNLGAAYARLAAHEDPQGNLHKAIEAYREALRFRTPETAPLLYAATQHKLGEAWRRRADLELDPARRCAHLQEAIWAFQEALRFRTLEATPLWHEQTRTALEEAQRQARAWGCPEEPTSERDR